MLRDGALLEAELVGQPQPGRKSSADLRRLLAWFARDGWLNAVAVALSLALFVLFVGFRDLPMIDLPQHAAQITTWQRLDAGDPVALERFELNFRTPYLLAYPLARALAPLCGVVLALKIVVWASIVASFFAVALLAKKLGHDPWLGLFGSVTAMGLCFYFGFVSFLVAMPLAVAALALALGHAARPSLQSGTLLALLMTLVLTAHGIAFMMAFGTVALLLLRGGGSWLARLAPLVPPALMALFWIAPGPVSVRIGGDAWGLTPERLRELPALLVGMGSSDHVAFVLGLALLTTTVLSLGLRLERRALHVLPLGLLLAAYYFFPVMFRGVVLLHTRLVCFLLPIALLAVAPRPSPAVSARRVSRALMLAVTLVWLGGYSLRLVAFNREAEAFHTLAARLPPGLAMRPLVFDRDSRAFPGVPAFLHYSAYYYVEKGGFQGYSFAMYPLSVVRYRPGIEATMQHGLEWRPDLFRQEEIPDYDYFLVRSEYDRTDELFAGTNVELTAHVGPWWGYTRRDSALAARTSPPSSRAPSDRSAGGT
jgi:hypothetical protein